ncbi:MAG TPA: hypothetical protein VN325_33455 [Steroidobacteraceae bacterium]|nr:hypothetical protein [Steroidobacteraceae bacterium]
MPLAPVALPTVVEAFALDLATCGNATAAYRRTHPTAGKSANAIEALASILRRRPDVAKRVDELRLIGAKPIVEKAPLMYVDLFDIGYGADANDLSGVRWVNCRRCHGLNAQPQWIDGNEFADACDQAAAKNAAVPGSAVPPAFGGFGFKVLGEPNPECLHCGGEGVQRPFIADTTKLEGPARKLFVSAKVKANGDIELNTEDRKAARDQLHKLLGLIVDKRITAHVDIDPNAPDPWSGHSLTPEQIMERVLRSRRVVATVDAQPIVDSAPDVDARAVDSAPDPVLTAQPAVDTVSVPLRSQARRPPRMIVVGPPQ